MKNKLKRDFRNAKKRKAPKEELAECAKNFHQCLRELNRLSKVNNVCIDQKNAESTRRKFKHNFWKFTQSLLDDAEVETTQPTFSKEEAHSHFSSVYSYYPHIFEDPSWLPRAPDPNISFNRAEIEVEEIECCKEIKVFFHAKSFEPDPLPHLQNVSSYNTNSLSFVQHGLVHWNQPSVMASSCN